MGTTEPLCPSCREPMELGMVYDRGHASSINLAEWVKGPVKYGGFFVGIETAGRDKYYVITYRCGGCGILQSYAIDKTD